MGLVYRIYKQYLKYILKISKHLTIKIGQDASPFKIKYDAANKQIICSL